MEHPSHVITWSGNNENVDFLHVIDMARAILVFPLEFSVFQQSIDLFSSWRLVRTKQNENISVLCTFILVYKIWSVIA